jgi:membrane protein
VKKFLFVVKRIPAQMRAHNLTLVSAGVAFYAFLAFVPTLIAVVSIYGLIAQPSQVEHHVNDIARALPTEVASFIKFQLTSIARADRTGVSVTLIVSLVIALWSASGGIAALVTGLHVVGDTTEPKSIVKRRGKALYLTLSAVILLVVVVFLVAVLPGIVDNVGAAGRYTFAVLRWPVLAFVMVLGVGTLYRLSVKGWRRGRLGVITPGALTAAALWVVVSAGFAVYTANFAHYSRTYGTLATIVVVLLWLYLSALAILVGAEVDTITR